MKTLTLLLLTLLATSSFAQDIIYKKDGEEIEVKLLEIGPEQIRYKLFNYQNGPIHIINLSEISKIIYANGESREFNISVTEKKTTQGKPEKTKYVRSDSDKEIIFFPDYTDYKAKYRGLVALFLETGEPAYIHADYINGKLYARAPLFLEFSGFSNLFKKVISLNAGLIDDFTFGKEFMSLSMFKFGLSIPFFISNDQKKLFSLNADVNLDMFHYNNYYWHIENEELKNWQWFDTGMANLYAEYVQPINNNISLIFEIGSKSWSSKNEFDEEENPSGKLRRLNNYSGFYPNEWHFYYSVGITF